MRGDDGRVWRRVEQAVKARCTSVACSCPKAMIGAGQERPVELESFGLRIVEKEVLLHVKAYHVQSVKQVRQKLAALHEGIERLSRGREDLRPLTRVEPS